MSDDDLNCAEDSYVELALDILAETEKLEKRLLGGQTIKYVQTTTRDKFGYLFFFSDDYLSSFECTLL